MKKGYWVVAYTSLLDESAVKAYGALALTAVESFCGRLLTMSTSQIQSHEAGLPLRTILVEFDSYEIALAARESEAYQKGASGARFRRGTRLSNRRRRVSRRPNRTFVMNQRMRPSILREMSAAAIPHQ
jgi:uncharacterized protein (DUF1330 family)